MRRFLWLSVLAVTAVGRAVAADFETSPAASKTLSAPPPMGAIVLFDGSNLDQWAKQKTKDWETADGPAAWKILPDGVLEVVPGANSIITKKKFKDFKLHAEFRVPAAKTKGAVFLLSRYELDINDNYGKPDATRCGAFNNLTDPIKPHTIATLPNEQWQTFDIDFRAPRLDESGKVLEKARATVWLNGVKIHDNVELGDRKGAAKRLGDATSGALMLQEHGSAHQYRNIWIVEQ
jgi:hypothetical protein